MKSKKEKGSAPVVVKEQSRLEKLDEVAKDIFESKQLEKQVKKNIETDREQFFGLASEELADQLGVLDRIVVPLAEVAQYPDYRELSRTKTEATLEQDLDKMPYEWIGDTFTVRRDIVHVGANFEAGRFYQDWVLDKESQDESEFGWYAELVVEQVMVPQYVFNEAKAQELIDEHPEFLPILQKYTSPGKAQTKLMIGKPKTEEDS